MTDNTPRPEPMSRESVLAVLNRLTHYCGDHELGKVGNALAAVAALYDSDIEIAYEMNAWKSRLDNQQRTIEQLQVEREAYRLRWEQSEACSVEINKLRVERDALKRDLDERNDGFWVHGKRHPMTSFSTGGTEASDAEGGG